MAMNWQELSLGYNINEEVKINGANPFLARFVWRVGYDQSDSAQAWFSLLVRCSHDAKVFSKSNRSR